MTLLEWLALAAYHRRTGRGVAKLSGNLLAGIAMLLAVRLALTGEAWWAVGGAMFGSLLAHLLDLRQRWRADCANGSGL